MASPCCLGAWLGTLCAMLGKRSLKFWGETKENRAFEDRHANTRVYIDYMRPRCVELMRVLKKTGSFYYQCDPHASHCVSRREYSLSHVRWREIVPEGNKNAE